MFLAEHPLCIECEKERHTTPATQVDHKTAHKGNYDLFWDEANWQALCASHHSRKTARKDGGFGNA